MDPTLTPQLAFQTVAFIGLEMMRSEKAPIDFFGKLLLAPNGLFTSSTKCTLYQIAFCILPHRFKSAMIALYLLLPSGATLPHLMLDHALHSGISIEKCRSTPMRRL